MELEIINKLFLELSQVATAKTARELELEAKCAEMRRVLKQFDWEDAMPCGFPSMSEWEHSLSTDCGKGKRFAK